MYNATITLNNGVKIPQLGYRHMDTAQQAASRYMEERCNRKKPYLIVN